MDGWHELVNILILLGAALVLGTLAEQLKQNAIIGYLLAGMLVGPNVFGWVSSVGEVNVIIEMGVALLLFSIGLEFSFQKLVRLGPVTLIVGVAQILITGLVGFCLASLFGMSGRSATAVGAVVSLSSTACVLRLLADNTLIDSVYGRYTTGILLLQDVAVVPLVLLVSTLGGEHSPLQTAWALLRTLGMSAVLFATLFLVLNYIVPSALNLRTWSKNRELPILLAVVIATGSALAAHKAGLSPAFGAFLAGLLLAQSPFSVQIRADVGSLRTLLVTLFFAAVGMLGDPIWMLSNWWIVGAAVAMIVILKTLIVWFVMRLCSFPNGIALATGVCLAQAGEFAFVLANISVSSEVIDGQTFRLLMSATIVSLLLTPYLVQSAPILARWAEPLKKRGQTGGIPTAWKAEKVAGPSQDPARSPVLVIGFGPAAQRVVELLSKKYADSIIVVDINPRNAQLAKTFGVEFHVGDARHADVLEHLHIRQAGAVVITLPDHDASRQIIHTCRSLAPEARIVVRARYHIFHHDLLQSGAHSVVDEENLVGLRLADEAQKALDSI